MVDRMICVVLAVAAALTVAISLTIGKTPYFGQFGRHFIAWRSREPRLFWQSIFGLAAVGAFLTWEALH